ncbi:MAG: T9SS type A sorting domain-containing protein, partial [Bacteroidetes bacterium]|nr:T9SS type A sorting domain-containing protein [Bacteroidota bacterium]
GQIYDHDAALRLRILNDTLFVTGSSNGSGTCTPPGKPSYNVNINLTWVAAIDGSTLSPTVESHFGINNFAGYLCPDRLVNPWGIDIIEDAHSHSGYYVAENREPFEWGLTHIESSTLQPSTPLFPASNSIYGAAFKVFGGSSHTFVGTNNRINLYGYGPAGPLSSTLGFVAIYSSGAGLTTTGYTWWQNSTTNSITALSFPDPPFWLNTNLQRWSLPDFGARYSVGTGAGKDALALMDQTEWTPGTLSPRFIQGGPDGEYSSGGSCPSSQDELSGFKVFSKYYLGVPVSPSISNVQTMVTMPPVDIQGNVHTIYSCDAGDPYRIVHRPAASFATAADGMAMKPNPAHEFVDASWVKPLPEDAVVRLVVQDMLGRTVYQGNGQRHNANEVRFNLPDLTPGVYVATVTLNGTVTRAQKLSIH